MSPMWFSCVSCVISVTYLFIPFTISTQEQVPSPNEESNMVSMPQQPWWWLTATSEAGPIFVFPQIHPFTLDAALSRGGVYTRHELLSFSLSPPPKCVKFRIVEGREILSLRHGLRDAYIGAQFDRLNMIYRAACKFPCTLSLVRGVLFVVDNSVGITMVSELFWATSFPVLSAQPEILQASSSHMSATAP